MAPAEKLKSALNRKFKKVREAPAGFGFFVSLHDFVQYLESTSSFDTFFRSKKGNRGSEISKRYSVLKQIYQGIEDLDVKTTKDLGHDRFTAIRDLTLIREQNVSENNSFWKNRESLRKLASDIHSTLHIYLSEPAGKV